MNIAINTSDRLTIPPVVCQSPKNFPESMKKVLNCRTNRTEISKEVFRQNAKKIRRERYRSGGLFVLK
jgi:hypothetical protein